LKVWLITEIIDILMKNLWTWKVYQ